MSDAWPRPAWSAEISLIGALLGADPARAATIIIVPICNEAGVAPHCSAGSVASHPDGTLEYEPTGAAIKEFTPEGLLTSGWISVPSASSILLSAVGSSAIRSITVPTGLATVSASAGSVAAEADGIPLGTFQPGASIDFEALLRGSGASFVRLTRASSIRSSRTSPGSCACAASSPLRIRSRERPRTCSSRSRNRPRACCSRSGSWASPPRCAASQRDRAR